MLKRLFIAVFVLGLVVGLSGTALSDVAKPSSALNPVEKIVPNHPRLDDVTTAGPAHSAFKKPAEALEQHLLPPGLQVPALKLDYFCDVQDYTSGSPAYFWTIPDAYGDDLFNMRFTADAGYDCTLKVAWLLMYADAQVGSPTLRVYLWDDDGFGFPGNKLDSVDIATPPAGGSGLYWLSADFSAADWVFSDGVNYHLGFTQLDQAGSVVAVISDAADGPFAGEERASEYYGTSWGTMLGDWGLDVSFFIQAERCCAEIPFTDCYSQAYIENVAYFWRAPHPVYGDEQYAEKFDVGGPETLTSIDIAIYGGGATWGSVTDPVGNNDIYIRVYDDNAGFPGDLLTTVTLPAGTYALYPALQNVPMPANFVLTNDFHVSFGTNGVFATSWESCLSSDGTDGSGRSSSYFDGGTGYEWFSFLDGWGMDAQFYWVANLCKDEYSDCSINYCYNGTAYYWQLPDRYGDYGEAQKFSSVGEECRVDAVTIAWYWNRAQYSWPRYTTPSYIKVWADAGGAPGAELGSLTVNPADYGIATPTPTASVTHWATYDMGGITVVGDYWVGVISDAADTLTGISVLSDAGGGGCMEGYAEYWGDWGLMYVDWGFGAGYEDLAMVIESEHCCIPYSERTCTTPTDWFTRGYGYNRSNASFVQMSDAWCDLTLNWAYPAATPVGFAGPVVYDGKVVCSFLNNYKVFDLISGALLTTITPQAGPFAPGDIRCTPTVTTIAGYPDPVLFVTGGTNDEVLAYNFNTYALLWSRHIGNMGPTGVFGDTRFGVFVVLNQGGTDVVYWTTDGGRLVAADALTGALYGGWAVNPFNPGKPCHSSLATNGSLLFFGTQASAVEGAVSAIDAATGAMVWQLSAAGGLQAATVYASTGGYAGTEGFTGGIAFDPQRNLLYFASRAYSGDFPTDGVFYRVAAGTGMLAGPALAATQTVYSGPTVDANRVYVAGNSRYVAAPFGGQIYAVDKATGVRVWAANAGPWGYIISPPAPTTASLDGCYNSAVLSCEPTGVADLLFAFGSFGGYYVYNAETGDNLYYNRVSVGTNPVAQRGFGGALQVDDDGASHLLFADNSGRLYDLTKQGDRPRLEIQHYDMKVPCPFGTDPNYLLTIPDVYTNTGCADLHFTNVIVDEISVANQWIPDIVAQYVPDDVMMKAAGIADRLTDFQFSGKFLREADATEDVVIASDDLERRTNYAAAGVPAWFNSMLHPAIGDVLIAGDTMDLQFYVNQAMILRGAQDFYLQVDSDDPEFFLNDVNKLPEQHVVVVGGCLTDTTTLIFGVGGANERLVSNTGRLATGDWGDGPAGYNGITIDGDVSSYFQGSFAFMGSKYQVAANTDDWGGGGTAMVSMQGDPNWCDDDCKPALQTGVTLGYITGDGGLTYDPILGNRVCYTILDSVQNFDAGTGWDWTWYDAPFDNALTMGLYANCRAVGALDVPELANMTIDVMEITERNGNAVDGWYLSHFFDCDNGSDTIQYNGTYSVAWTLDGGAAQAIGNVKIPFGCGYTPIVNIWGTYGVSGSHGFWDWTQYWDTAYWYCTQGYGAKTEATGMHGGDEEAHVTLDQHNFAPNETYTVGIATFELFGLTNSLDANNPDIIALAKIANQWAGFGRGDVNNDGAINLADIIYLAGTVNGGPGAIPFQHLADVNADGNIDVVDVDFLIDYYFNCGPCPTGDWIF